MGPHREKTQIQLILRGGRQRDLATLTARKRPLESSSNNNVNSTCTIDPTASAVVGDSHKNDTVATVTSSHDVANAVSPAGSTASSSRNGVFSIQQELQQDGGEENNNNDDENAIAAPQHKRRRLDCNNVDDDDIDSSNNEDGARHAVTKTTTALSTGDYLLHDPAVRARRKRRKQIAYYRKCCKDAPPPTIRSKKPVPIPLLTLQVRQQRQQPRLVAVSQLMAIAWYAKLDQENQSSQVLQSSRYRFMQLQLQRALRRLQEQQQQQQQVIQDQSQKEGNAEQDPQPIMPNQQEQEEEHNNQSQQQQQQQVQPTQSQQDEEEQKDVTQLERECSMWQIQNEQLQKDFQKERKSKLALVQEQQSLEKKLIALMKRNKKFKASESRNFQWMREKEEEVERLRAALASFNSPPATPASTATSTNNNNNNNSSNSKTSTSESSRLVPRELLQDYSPDEQQQQQQDQQKSSSSVISTKDHLQQYPPSNRLAKQNHNIAGAKPRLDTLPISARTKKNIPFTPSDQKSKAAPPGNQIPDSTKSLHHHSNKNGLSKLDKESSRPVPAASSMTPSHRSNQHQMLPPAPLAHKGNKRASSTSSNGDASLLQQYHRQHRVLPAPSSQTSIGSSEATERHKNTVSNNKHSNNASQPESSMYDDSAKENIDPKLDFTQTTTETQATVPPSANLLADTEPYHVPRKHQSQPTAASSFSGGGNDNSPSSIQPSAILLEGTAATQIHHALPISKSTVNDDSSTKTPEERMEENHPNEPECEEEEMETEDPIVECSPNEDQSLSTSTTTIMPPPPLPPAPTTPKKAFPTALSRMDLHMDSPPVQEASQTTFHDGRTSEPRRKGTLVTTLVNLRIQTKPIKPAPASANPSLGKASDEQQSAATTTTRTHPERQENNRRLRRVSVSPPAHTKPMQLPFVSTQPQQSLQKSNGSARQDSSNRSTTTTNYNYNKNKDPSATRKTNRWYSGYARNVWRPKTQEGGPKPDAVPSNDTVDSSNPTGGLFCQVIAAGKGIVSSAYNTNSGMVTSKTPPKPAKKSPVGTSRQTTTTSAPRKPGEQPWIKNRSYNDFMEDTPPSSSRQLAKLATTITRPKPRQPYQRKIMGGGSKVSTETNFRYEEVVRKKAQRETMKTSDCPDCGGFFDQCERDGINRDQLRCFCRHRTICTPTNTPDGFWELSFRDEKKQQRMMMMMETHHESSSEEEGSVQDI